MVRMLGLTFEPGRTWAMARGGRRKAEQRRADRESRQAHRRRERGAADPPEDPCVCRHRCPECDQRCLGGHAMLPGSHWCFELHHWST